MASNPNWGNRQLAQCSQRSVPLYLPVTAAFPRQSYIL